VSLHLCLSYEYVERTPPCHRLSRRCLGYASFGRHCSVKRYVLLVIDSLTTYRCVNPSYTSSELVHSLQASKARFIFAHPPSLSVALEAAKEVGIPARNIILFNAPGVPSPKGFATIDDLVVSGLTRPQGFVEVRLAPGEAKTKVAFLNFSSGTTGKPKVEDTSRREQSIEPHHLVRPLPSRTTALWRTLSNIAFTLE
jgi:hypothetical protein